MQVSSLLNSSGVADSSATQTNKKNSTSSFASLFSRASSQSVSTNAASTGDDGLQDFLRYAKETPAQRMFDGWLSSQHISMSQYNAMSTSEKEKLTQQFEQYMKETMKTNVAGASSASAAVVSA